MSTSVTEFYSSWRSYLPGSYTYPNSSSVAYWLAIRATFVCFGYRTLGELTNGLYAKL